MCVCVCATLWRNVTFSQSKLLLQLFLYRFGIFQPLSMCMNKVQLIKQSTCYVPGMSAGHRAASSRDGPAPAEGVFRARGTRHRSGLMQRTARTCGKCHRRSLGPMVRTTRGTCRSMKLQAPCSKEMLFHPRPRLLCTTYCFTTHAFVIQFPICSPGNCSFRVN